MGSLRHPHPDAPSGRPHPASSGLRTALAITVTVMVIEFLGGWLSNSLALIADAGHMLTDAGALALAWFALWFSSRPATASKTYGFYRVEILAALLNGIVLVLVALFIFREAYQRVMDPPEVNADLMLLVASGGLLANIASGYVLHRAQAGSLNVRGAFLHVVSDAIGSAGAILASLAILFFDWRVADSLISVLVAVLILSSSWRLIREAVNILLEGAPAHIDLKSLSEGIVSAAGVSSVHDLHVWTLTSGVVAMSCHVVAAPGRAGSDVLARVSGIAQGSFGIDHATIQVEYEEEGGPRAGACVCQFGAR